MLIMYWLGGKKRVKKSGLSVDSTNSWIVGQYLQKKSDNRLRRTLP
jgi:hypothetical protein